MVNLLTALAALNKPVPVSEPTQSEPFIPPVLDDLSDRQLLEQIYYKLARAEHMVEQTMIAAQSSPILASFIPRP